MPHRHSASALARRKRLTVNTNTSRHPNATAVYSNQPIGLPSVQYIPYILTSEEASLVQTFIVSLVAKRQRANKNHTFCSQPVPSYYIGSDDDNDVPEYDGVDNAQPCKNENSPNNDGVNGVDNAQPCKNENCPNNDSVNGVDDAQPCKYENNPNNDGPNGVDNAQPCKASTSHNGDGVNGVDNVQPCRYDGNHDNDGLNGVDDTQPSSVTYDYPTFSNSRGGTVHVDVEKYNKAVLNYRDRAFDNLVGQIKFNQRNSECFCKAWADFAGKCHGSRDPTLFSASSLIHFLAAMAQQWM